MSSYEMILWAKERVQNTADINDPCDAWIECLSVTGAKRNALAAVFAAGLFYNGQFLMPPTWVALRAFRSIQPNGTELKFYNEFEAYGCVTRTYAAHTVYR